MTEQKGAQFWDTSALVALILIEPHTPAAIQARDQAHLCMAWDWVYIEARSALRRRGAKPAQLQALNTILSQFQFITFDAADHPAILRLIDRYRLRAGDAGHLFALLQSRKVQKEVEFICFDDELVKAAKAEGVSVFKAAL